MDTFIPALGQFFEKEREKQQFLVKTSLIQKDVEDTRDKMAENITLVVDRGETLDDLEDKAVKMEEESRQFYLATLSWYQRWWYWLKRCDKRCCMCVPGWWINVKHAP